MIRPIQLIRKAAQNEELDYVFLTECLQQYASPRTVIHRLLRSGDLIRVKKGIYVFGSMHAQRPYSLEILANMIYGPSYISREYALSYWGLIPEGVMEVTSMTSKRNKFFNTPVGRFSYSHIPHKKYILGITRISFSHQETGALIATPEKALIDLLFHRKETAKTSAEWKRILMEDLRIDPEGLAKMRIGLLKEILQAYSSSVFSNLERVIREMKNDI